MMGTSERARGSRRADAAGRLEAIHLRHLDVHEHQVELGPCQASSASRRCWPPLPSSPAFRAVMLATLLVDRVVLGQQQRSGRFAGSIRRRRPRFGRSSAPDAPGPDAWRRSSSDCFTGLRRGDRARSRSTSRAPLPGVAMPDVQDHDAGRPAAMSVRARRLAARQPCRSGLWRRVTSSTRTAASRCLPLRQRGVAGQDVGLRRIADMQSAGDPSWSHDAAAAMGSSWTTSTGRPRRRSGRSVRSDGR